jgi:hypothetical protein
MPSANISTEQPRGRHLRKIRRRRRRAAKALIGSGLLFGCILLAARPAFPFWVASTNSAVPTADASTLPQGATPGAPAAAPNGTSVTISFAQSDTSGGIPITNYTVQRYAVGSTTVSHTFTCTGSTSSVSCSDPNVPSGQWQYTDTPTFGTNWEGLESEKSPLVAVVSTSPIVTISFPIDSTTYGANWSGAITGTASDDGTGVAGVRVAVEDTSTDEWWDGSSFDLSSQTSVPVTSGTTSWSLTLPVAALTTSDSYAVVAQATDGVGTIGTSPTVAFTFDALQAATPEVATPLFLPLLALALFFGAFLWMKRRRGRPVSERPGHGSD